MGILGLSGWVSLGVYHALCSDNQVVDGTGVICGLSWTGCQGRLYSDIWTWTGMAGTYRGCPDYWLLVASVHSYWQYVSLLPKAKMKTFKSSAYM